MNPFAKPHPLKPGDCVAIAAPGASLTKEQMPNLERAISILEAWGFRVLVAPDAKRQRRYCARQDRERAHELMALFSNPAIRAILCARGGYGSQRILPFLDPHLIRKNPKVFVGSSDITVILVYLMERCGMIAFHGPNVATAQFLEGDTARTRASLRRLLGLAVPAEPPPCKTLRRGVGEGRIKGGCLSLLVTTIGTTYEIDLRDAILFFEDFNEPPYRVDRMLTHMKQAGKLDRIRGLIVGEMAGVQGEERREMEAVVLDIFRDQEIPILFGFPSGHGRKNLTIPLGVQVTLDGEKGRLIFHEAGFST